VTARLAGQSRRAESRTEVDYRRWLREGDAEELIYAMGGCSYERAPVKRDDRISRSGQDYSSRGADDNKRCLKKGYDRQREGLAKSKGDL